MLEFVLKNMMMNDKIKSVLGWCADGVEEVALLTGERRRNNGLNFVKK